MQTRHRLRARSDIAALFRRGDRRIERAYYRILARKNVCGYLRVATVTPRAIEKRAVLRNRLRRRSLEWIRKREPLLHEPFDVVLVFKKHATSIPRDTLYEELERGFGLLIAKRVSEKKV